MSGKKTVLIVDDEEDLRDTLEFQFKHKGYNAITAFDGLDALEKLKAVTPDLIILDMNMPRMNGLEFYQKITGVRERPPYPVLVLTARANMEQLFRDLAVDGFMTKPFELDDVIQEAATIIKKNAGAMYVGSSMEEKRARHICIVENDPDLCTRLAVAFLEAGYIVNVAQSGASAFVRMNMDVPDVALIKLGLNDIAGDVAILKLKSLKKTQKVKCVLYSSKSADRALVTEKISEKAGIEHFVEFSIIDELLMAVDDLFRA